MTFARKTLGLALATLTLGFAAVAETPASAHDFFRFGFHVGHERFDVRFGDRRPSYGFVVENPRVVCPYGTHLGPQGHYCWPNDNGYGYGYSY